MKILVADHSKANLQMILAVLTKLGHDAILATSGSEAIELFQKIRPDLIMLDVVMQGMDGFECAKQLRALDGDEWIPLIFLSEKMDEVSLAKSIDAGGDDYLTKPLNEMTLVAKMKVMQRISDVRQKLVETTQKLSLSSSTDPLTGLYNRLQFGIKFKELMAAADRYHHKMALLFVDLDHFKNINDSFGHRIGDLLLIEVAKRIKSCIRSVDFVARLGGDEFAIILSEIEEVEEAGQVAQKIISALSVDYILESHNIRNAASVGVAIYPNSSTNQENLILNADMAMYHAKASGRNNYQYFTEELNEKYKQQINLEHALKFAVEREEIFLTYQPIFETKTRHVVGLETLLCWEHPQFGLISPNVFVPLAEETGLIPHIGAWVLETAFKQAAKWPLDQFKNFKFAINISSRQIVHENFFQQIVDLLKSTSISPHQLELELTETTMMTYTIDPFMEVMNKLHDMGISISIDDFGIGYSSLIRLKHLPINTLKIDKSFVQDVHNPNSAIIVNCLIELGKNLNLNVIAEGVENKDQLDFLVTHHCPQVQGYYLSKPLDAEQITAFLATHPNKAAG